MSAIAQAISARLRSRAREWAWKRQGTDSATAHLHSQRIFILPTRAGLIFAFIVFTMLLGAMNYNNNMGFALTFLLAGIGIISIHHCHRNLADLYLHFVGSQPVFAGETAIFRFALENKSMVSRWQITCGWEGGETICNEVAGEARESVAVRVRTTRRGFVAIPRLQLSTRFPLGLLRAWAWVNMESRELVYPEPARRKSRDQTGFAGQTTSGYDRGGDDDFSGLRDYRLGDPPKHIAWKALARTGETLVTEYHSGSHDLVWIDWNDFPNLQTERRLSALTRKVLDVESAGLPYGMRIPGSELAPATGAAHRHECLRALALFGSAPDARARS